MIGLLTIRYIMAGKMYEMINSTINRIIYVCPVIRPSVFRNRVETNWAADNGNYCRKIFPFFQRFYPVIIKNKLRLRVKIYARLLW